MRRLTGGVLAILGCLLLTGTRAQAATLDEREFWSRMEQTNRLLDETIGTPVDRRAPILASMSSLWQGIDQVRLADQTLIPVDMGWLRTIMPTETPRLTALQRRVQAILAYHARQATSTDSGGSLAALDKVLSDPRFQYPDATLTPTPEPNTPSSSQVPPVAAPGLWQLAFVFVGLIVVIGVLFYLARTLRFQRAALDTPPEPGDDPPTSAAAHDLAAESAAAHDYRSAIRYLYLASLLKLDERGLIRYDRTLTNREHLRQVSGNPQLVEALQPVVYTFDRVWYGFAPVDEPRYQTFRQDVERLEQLTP